MLDFFRNKGLTSAVYGAVIVVFLLAGLFAALGPARRATRVDPLVALRQD